MIPIESGKPQPLVLELVAGVEGDSVYLNDPSDHYGYRIAGPKPWGGGKVKQRWILNDSDIPEIRKMLNRRSRQIARAKRKTT